MLKKQLLSAATAVFIACAPSSPRGLGSFTDSPSFLFVSESATQAAATDPNDDAHPPLGDSLDSKQDQIETFVGSNARWIVDRQRGAISAWELTRNAPLWTRDGTVYRTFERPKHDVALLTSNALNGAKPACEFFGRVYFLLDAIEDSRVTRFFSTRCVKNDDLLVVLDTRNQGRLVWSRRADDFAPFFSSRLKNKDSRCRFVGLPRSFDNDFIKIQVQREQEVNFFLIDAASGETRFRY